MSEENVVTIEHITFDDFKKIELKVATILEAERVEGTDKLMKLQIDLGDEKRQIVAGIATAYRADTLVGKNIVVVVNLAPVKLRGVESNGMLLAATVGGRPELVTFDRVVTPGVSVS
jgi:methionyl-tRNA synthetase